MDNRFEAALALHRSSAAKAFQQFRSSNVSPELRQSVKESASVSPYVRELFPALREYLISAAVKYATLKTSPQLKSQSFQCSCILGSTGKPVLELAADVRRHRWMISLSETRHRVRSWRHRSLPFVDIAHVVSLCKIPSDVRQICASRFRATRNAKSLDNSVAKLCRTQPSALALHGMLKWTPDESCKEAPRPLQPPPSIHHSRKCQHSIAIGESGLTRQLIPSPPVTRPHDSFEDTRQRYAGKPDELYRRKNSRKFASWRRRMQEMRLARVKIVENAEANMRATRGYDQLQTQRSYGDRTLAPFLFQSDTHTYVHSSRISDAPKLRKVMIDKYSTLKNVGSANDPYRKAVEAAENNPLFHTRVMNRFN